MMNDSAPSLRFLLIIQILLAAAPVFPERIQFKADSMTGVSGSKTDETKLSGDAFVKTSTMEIKADVITLDGDDFRYITAEGSVEGKNTETKMDFTCGKLRFDRQTKIARLEDSVHMVDTENEVTTDAQIIEYNQNKEIATMQIGVTLRQKNNTCTSAFAIYRKGEQMLEMSGNPKIVQGDDTFRAQEIILNLNSQEITLSGRVSGTVTDSKKDESQGGAKNSRTDDEKTISAENQDGAGTDEEKPDMGGESPGTQGGQEPQDEKTEQSAEEES